MYGQGAWTVAGAIVPNDFGHFQQRVTLITHGVTLFAQRVTLVQNFAGPTHGVKIDAQFVIWTAQNFLATSWPLTAQGRGWNGCQCNRSGNLCAFCIRCNIIYTRCNTRITTSNTSTIFCGSHTY